MPGRLRKLLFWRRSADIGSLTAEPRPLVGRLRVVFDGKPIQIELGGRSLRLYPEVPLNQPQRPPQDWILVDGERCFSEICGFARIGRGTRLCIGRGNESLKRLFGFTKGVKERHLEIENDGGELILSRLDPDAKIQIRHFDEPEEATRRATIRLNNLAHVRDIFGGPIELLSPKEALATLQQVNENLLDDRRRTKDSHGRPGGLVELPGSTLPVIVGDLHARIDNLLKILSEDAYLGMLERGEACLILLGDAVHSELDGELEEMDTSLLMLDLIFKLMIRFRDSMIYLRGNHESFDAEVGKSGVPQGILFRKHARALRGKSYVKELGDFFELMPYLVRSSDFIACHGGPPRGRTSVQDVVDIVDHPNLARALVWNRLKGPRAPAGYRKKDVKRFRASLGVEKGTPFVVGHNPLSREETAWPDAGEIRNHHIVFSAHTHKLGLVTRIGEHLMPLEYPAEALLDLTNGLQPAADETDEQTIEIPERSSGGLSGAEPSPIEAC